MKTKVYKIYNDKNEVVHIKKSYNEQREIVENKIGYWSESFNVDAICLNWDNRDYDHHLSCNSIPRCPYCGYEEEDFYLEAECLSDMEEECSLCEKTYLLHGEIEITYCSEELD